MSKKYSRKTTKKTQYKLSPKEADMLIKDEFITPKGYKMQKQFIFRPEKPDESGINIYFNHERNKE